MFRKTALIRRGQVNKRVSVSLSLALEVGFGGGTSPGTEGGASRERLPSVDCDLVGDLIDSAMEDLDVAADSTVVRCGPAIASPAAPCTTLMRHRKGAGLRCETVKIAVVAPCWGLRGA